MGDLGYCIQELRSIIIELKDISYNLDMRFKGVGTDLCADCIDKSVRKYEKILRKLESL
jgi:hypothetical protein